MGDKLQARASMSLETFQDGADWPNAPERGTRTLPYVEEPIAAGRNKAPRQLGRRLSDKIMIAFHQACDLGDYEIADELLRLVEVILTRKPTPQHASRRRNMENLVAAHERLWQLRNPDAEL